jgi:hypothetical protein
LKVHAAGIGLDRAGDFNDDVLRRLAAVPGVTGASLSELELFTGGHARDRVSLGTRSFQSDLGTVTAAYFRNMGIGVQRGRAFGAGDRRGRRRWRW